MNYLHLAQQQSKRFWSKVRQSSTSMCWLWQAATDKDGYGKFQITTHARPKQIHVRAHRLAYEMMYGAVPAHLVVMHKCDVPQCVRPSHLRLGTQKENRDDCGRKGRNATGAYAGARTCPEARPRGERHYKATVSAKQVRRMRTLHKRGARIATVAREIGCSYATAWAVVAGKSWKGVR